MNEENLKKGNPDTQFQTGREQVEIARQGGITSGKSRRKKADMRKAVQSMLDNTYNSSDGKELSGAEVMALKLFKIATNEKDKQCISAIKLIIELTGQNKDTLTDKKTKTEIKLLEARINALTNSDTTALDKLDEILKNIKSKAEQDEKEGET